MADSSSIAPDLPPSYKELDGSTYDPDLTSPDNDPRQKMDPHFTLRSGSKNIMLDSGGVLLGLAIRLSTLEEHQDVPKLYGEVSNHIRNILEEVRRRDYDDASFAAFSYCMCVLMDDVVMSRPWGTSSIWSEHSMLSEFHQETNGGEKIFILIERMLAEPAKYADVLEFMYFSVAVGLEGKYALVQDGQKQLQALIVRMHRAIRDVRGPVPDFPDSLVNVVHCKPRRHWKWPWWSPFAIAGAVMAIVYTGYSMRLDSITQEVLQSLEPLLKP